MKIYLQKGKGLPTRTHRE